MYKSEGSLNLLEMMMFAMIFFLGFMSIDSVKAQENDFSGEVKDAWIAGKLESAYIFNKHLNPFDIDIEVEGGEVKLSGFVKSDIDKDLAENIAKGIKGVSEVDNQISVDNEYKSKQSRDTGVSTGSRDFGNWVSNATMSASVKTKLLANKNIDGLDVNVDSKDGIVTLKGKVESEEAKDLAEVIAGNTENVKEVNNRLSVVKK